MVVVARPAQPPPPGSSPVALGCGRRPAAPAPPHAAAAGSGGRVAAAAAAAAAVAAAAAAARLGEAGRGFVLSPPFQAAVQLVAGELVTGLFVVVRPLAFPTSCLAPALYSAWTVLFAADNHLGSRLQAGAVAAAAMGWGAVMGGAVLSLALALVPAAGSPAHTGVLCVLALALLPALAASRAALGPGRPPFMWVAGSTASLAYGVAVLMGQPLRSVAAVWSGVVRNLVLVGLLGGGCGGAVAAAVLPSLAAHELREDAAAVVRGAGHAITRIASKALQPQPDICWSAEGGGWRPAMSAALSPPGGPAVPSLPPHAADSGWSGRADGAAAATAEAPCAGDGGRVHTMAMPPLAGAAGGRKLHAAIRLAAAEMAAPAPAPAGPVEADPAAHTADTLRQTPAGSGRMATPAAVGAIAAGGGLQLPADEPLYASSASASSASSSDEDAFHLLRSTAPAARGDGGTADALRAAPAPTTAAAATSTAAARHGLGHPSDDNDDGHADDEAEDAEDDDAFLQMLHEASEPCPLAAAYAGSHLSRRRSSASVLERVSVATAVTADAVAGWWWRLRVRARLWALRLRRCCCGPRAEATTAERTLSLPVFVAPPGGLRPSPAVAVAATALSARQHRQAAAVWRPRPASSAGRVLQQQKAPAALGRTSMIAAPDGQQQQLPLGSGERVGAVGGGGGVGQAAAVAWAPVSVLRPLLGRAWQCVASSRMEPPWLIDGPSDMDRWSRLLCCCEVLVGRVEALGALLEHRGRRAVPLGDPHLAQLLGGGDVVGPYRVAHARAAAACAAVSSALSASAAAAATGGPQGHRRRSSSCSCSCTAAWLLWGKGRQTAATAASGARPAAAELLLPVVTDWEAVRRQLKAAVRCGFRGYWGRLRAVAAAAAATEEAAAAGNGVESSSPAVAAGETVACDDKDGSAEQTSPPPGVAAQPHHQAGRRRRVPILGIEQARALMFMWAVSDGVLAAVAELEAAARDLLLEQQPTAPAPAPVAAPGMVEPGNHPLPHTAGQAPLQQQREHSLSAPALTRSPRALPPEGRLESSSANTKHTTDSGSSSTTAEAGQAGAPPAGGGAPASPAAAQPPALQGRTSLLGRTAATAATAQLRVVGAGLERDFGWAWRVLQIGLGWQVVTTTARALAASPRLLLDVVLYGIKALRAAARRSCLAASRVARRAAAATRIITTNGPRRTRDGHRDHHPVKAGARPRAAAPAAAPSAAPPPTQPLWSSRLFQFGFKYWLTCGAVLVGTLGVSARPELAPLLRRYPPMYGYIAACVAMTERVESTASRVVLRLLGTLAGGSLGLAALLRPRLANSPPALLALVCGTAFPVACLSGAGSRFKPAIVLTLVTLSAMTLCHQPRAAGGSSNPPVPGDSATAEGVALRLFAVRVASVSLGCTLPLLVSRALLPWYTRDWALERMAGAFEGCERLTRQLYEQFYMEGLRAHVAARGQHATDALLQRWGLPAVPTDSRGGSGGGTGDGASGAAAGGGGDAALDKTTATSTSTSTTSAEQLQVQVIGPLVAVQRSLLRDTAVWTRGTLSTPEVVAALLRALLPLADRLAALQLVVAETPPLVHGRLSGWAFEAIVLPLHADMRVMLDALLKVVAAARALLAAEYLKATARGASGGGSSRSEGSGCGTGGSGGAGGQRDDRDAHGKPRDAEAVDIEGVETPAGAHMPPRAALSAAVQSLDLARLQVRRRLRGMRRAFHAAVLALDEQRLPYATHPDDAVRVNAMLFALVQVLDRSTAAARCLSHARQ